MALCWVSRTRAQCTFVLYVPLQQYGAGHPIDSLSLSRGRTVGYRCLAAAGLAMEASTGFLEARGDCTGMADTTDTVHSGPIYSGAGFTKLKTSGVLWAADEYGLQAYFLTKHLQEGAWGRLLDRLESFWACVALSVYTFVSLTFLSCGFFFES